jgi:uncharacterized protein (DUF58 family)
MFSETFTPQYLAQLELLRLKTRKAFTGLRHGSRTSLKRGHGMEFAEYRRYQLGDNPRHIDWGLYGRSDKMYVKTFQEEQNISALLILDTTNSMLAEADASKWRLTRELFLSIAYIALAGQETVTVCIPGTVTSYSCHGPRAIYRIAQLVDSVKGCEQEAVSQGILSAVSSLKVPGVALYFSDFLFEHETTVRQLNMLLAKNLEVTLVQVLGDKDIDPLGGQESVRLVDSESREEITLRAHSNFNALYAAKLKMHQEELAAITHKRQIKFASVNTRHSLIEFLSRNLTSLGVVS